MAEFDAKRIVEDAQADKRLSPEIEQEILRAIARIDFGSIEVVVHDGKVVQIECREKIRVVRDEPRAARTRYVKSASRGNPARHHPRQASQTNGGGKQQIYIGDLTG